MSFFTIRDKECLFPVSPEPASYDPEEFVDDSQPWPRLLALKNGELLAKGEIFEHQTAAHPKQAKHGSEPEPKQVKHGNQVIADRLCRLPCEVIDFTAGQDCDEGETFATVRDLSFQPSYSDYCRNIPIALIDRCEWSATRKPACGRLLPISRHTGCDLEAKRAVNEYGRDARLPLPIW